MKLRRIFRRSKQETTTAPEPLLPEPPPAQLPLVVVGVTLPPAPKPQENMGIDFMLQRLAFLTQDVHPLV